MIPKEQSHNKDREAAQEDSPNRSNGAADRKRKMEPAGGIQTVALIGLGAIGAYLAPRLQQTLGDRFCVIADGPRKTRLEEEGIQVNGIFHRFRVEPPQTPNPVSLVLVAVKWAALEEAIEQIRGHVGPDTLILPLLNGVDSERRLMEVYGEERVLYGVTRVSVQREGNRIQYREGTGRIEFGRADNQTLSPAVVAVRELFERAGIPYRIPQDMIHAIWLKFMCNIGENLTSALLGTPYRALQTSPHADAIRRGAMAEVVAVAQSRGIPLTQEDLDWSDRNVLNLPPAGKPSTLQDLLAGRKTEIDMFSGQLIRMAEECGIPAPYNQVLFHGICCLEEKNDGLFEE